MGRDDVRSEVDAVDVDVDALDEFSDLSLIGLIGHRWTPQPLSGTLVWKV